MHNSDDREDDSSLPRKRGKEAIENQRSEERVTRRRRTRQQSTQVKNIENEIQIALEFIISIDELASIVETSMLSFENIEYEALVKLLNALGGSVAQAPKSETTLCRRAIGAATTLLVNIVRDGCTDDSRARLVLFALLDLCFRCIDTAANRGLPRHRVKASTDALRRIIGLSIDHVEVQKDEENNDDFIHDAFANDDKQDHTDTHEAPLDDELIAVLRAAAARNEQTRRRVEKKKIQSTPNTRHIASSTLCALASQEFARIHAAPRLMNAAKLAVKALSSSYTIEAVAWILEASTIATHITNEENDQLDSISIELAARLGSLAAAPSETPGFIQAFDNLESLAINTEDAVKASLSGLIKTTASRSRQALQFNASGHPGVTGTHSRSFSQNLALRLANDIGDLSPNIFIELGGLGPALDGVLAFAAWAREADDSIATESWFSFATHLMEYMHRHIHHRDQDTDKSTQSSTSRRDRKRKHSATTTAPPLEEDNTDEKTLVEPRHAAAIVYAASIVQPETASVASQALMALCHSDSIRSVRSAAVAICRSPRDGHFELASIGAYAALKCILCAASTPDEGRDVAELVAAALLTADRPLPYRLARLILEVITNPARKVAACRAAAPAIFAAVEQPLEESQDMERKARRCDLLRAILEATALVVPDEVDDDFDEDDDFDDRVLEAEEIFSGAAEVQIDLSPLASLARQRPALAPAVDRLICDHRIGTSTTQSHIKLVVAAWRLRLRLPRPSSSSAATAMNPALRASLEALQASVVALNGPACGPTVAVRIAFRSLLEALQHSSSWLLPAAVETIFLANVGSVELAHLVTLRARRTAAIEISLGISGDSLLVARVLLEYLLYYGSTNSNVGRMAQYVFEYDDDNEDEAEHITEAMALRRQIGSPRDILSVLETSIQIPSHPYKKPWRQVEEVMRLHLELEESSEKASLARAAAWHRALRSAERPVQTCAELFRDIEMPVSDIVGAARTAVALDLNDDPLILIQWNATDISSLLVWALESTADNLVYCHDETTHEEGLSLIGAPDLQDDDAVTSSCLAVARALISTSSSKARRELLEACQTTVTQLGVARLRHALGTATPERRIAIETLLAVALAHDADSLLDTLQLVLLEAGQHLWSNLEKNKKHSIALMIKEIKKHCASDRAGTDAGATTRLVASLAWLSSATAEDGAAARGVILELARHEAPTPMGSGDRILEALLVLATALELARDGDALARTLSALGTKACSTASNEYLSRARALELITATVRGVDDGLCRYARRDTFVYTGEVQNNLSKDEPRCTYARSGGEFVDQHWYNCATCGLVGDKGCCAVCVRVCHAGHDVSYSRRSSFFCDCGAESRSSPSEPPKPEDTLHTGVRRLSACKCLGSTSSSGAPPISSARARSALHRSSTSASRGIHKRLGFKAMASSIPLTASGNEQEFKKESIPKGVEQREAFLRRLAMIASAAAYRLAAKDMFGLRTSLCATETLIPAIEAALRSLGNEAVGVAHDLTFCERRSLEMDRATTLRASTSSAKTKSSTRPTRSQPTPHTISTATAIPGKSLEPRAWTVTNCFDVRSLHDLGASPSARQLRSLAARNRIHPHFVSADGRGRVAIVERRNINICAMSNALCPLQGTPKATSKARICVLAKLSVPFDVVGINFNHAADRHLVCWGLREVVVFALDGGAMGSSSITAAAASRKAAGSKVDKARTQDEVARLVRNDAVVRIEVAGLESLSGGESAHLVRCIWVPGRTTCLAVVTVVGVRIYDLAESASIPTHVFVLVYESHRIRDATMAPGNRSLSGCAALYVILETGRVYGAELRRSTTPTADATGNEEERRPSEVYLDLDALPTPARLFSDAGHGRAIFYAPQAHALIISRDGAPAVAVRLGDTGVRDVRGAYRLLSKPQRNSAVTPTPSSGSSHGNMCPYSSWLEWPTPAGETACTDGDVDSARPLAVVCIGRGGDTPSSSQPPSRGPVQRASSLNSVMSGSRGAASVADASSSRNSGESVVLVTRGGGNEDRPPLARECNLGISQSRRILGTCLWRNPGDPQDSLLVLLDDGSLRAYDSPIHPDALSSDYISKDDDDNRDDKDEELCYRSDDAKKMEAKPPPCTIFERLHLLTAHRVEIDGDLVVPTLRSSSADAVGHTLPFSFMEGGSALIRTPRKLETLAAVRLLLSAAIDQTPSASMIIAGRQMPLLPGKRWYDIILTDTDKKRLTSVGGLVVSIVDAHIPPPLIDAVEAYVIDEKAQTDTSEKQLNKARTMKDSIGFAAGFVDDDTSLSPRLQRAVVAAARARVALAQLITSTSEDDTKRRPIDESQECFFHLDEILSASSKTSIERLRPSLSPDLAAAAKDEDDDVNMEDVSIESSNSSLANIASRLVEFICLARDKRDWSGLRAAASTFCDVASNFDRRKARHLADTARLRRFEAAIMDHNMLEWAPASIALLSLGLATAQPTAFFATTDRLLTKDFVFVKVMDQLIVRVTASSKQKNKQAAINVLVNLACREMKARGSQSIEVAFDLLRVVLENSSADIADPATAALSKFLTKTICKNSESTRSGPNEKKVEYTADAKDNAMQDDEDEKDELDEPLDSKPEPTAGATGIAENISADETGQDDVFGHTMIRLICHRIQHLVTVSLLHLQKSDTSSLAGLQIAQHAARYIAVLLKATSMAAPRFTVLVADCITKLLGHIMLDDAILLRTSASGRTKPDWHGVQMTLHDGVIWRGDVTENWFAFSSVNDAVKADVGVMLLVALRRLCSPVSPAAQSINEKRTGKVKKAHTGESTLLKSDESDKTARSAAAQSIFCANLELGFAIDASTSTTSSVKLKDALVARCRRALAVCLRHFSEDEEEEVDECECQERDALDDEDVAFRRAMLLGVDAGRHAPTSRRTILLNRDPIERDVLAGGVDEDVLFPDSLESTVTVTTSSESKDDDDIEAVAAADTSAKSQREWWATYYLDEESKGDLHNANGSPIDVRTAMNFFGAAVEACAALESTIQWPAAFAVMLCEAASEPRLPRNIRRASKRALRRVCGGSEAEYRSMRDTFTFAATAKVLKSTVYNANDLDYAETARVETSLVEALALARRNPHNWRTFCARSFTEEPSIEDEAGSASSLDVMSVTVNALFELCAVRRLPTESTALRVSLELLELCTRPPRAKYAEDDAREDARAETESLCREALEENASRSSAEIDQCLEIASRRRAFANFLGFSTPTALMDIEATDRRPSRAVIALMRARSEAQALANDLINLAAKVVVDGPSSALRDTGAAFLSHVYAVLPIEAKTLVFTSFATVASRETRSSAGGRGTELLSVLSSAVSAAGPESLTAVKSLARNVRNILITCATTLDAHADALAVYAVTDSLGLPRYFDADTDADTADNAEIDFRRQQSEKFSTNKEQSTSSYQSNTQRTRRVRRFSEADLPLPYYDSRENDTITAHSAFLFDNNSSIPTSQRAYPRHRAGSLESLSLASTEAHLGGCTSFSLDLAFSDRDHQISNAEDMKVRHDTAMKAKSKSSIKPSKARSSASSAQVTRQSGNSVETKPSKFVPLEELRIASRYTEYCAIIQLRGVRRITEIEVKVREARCRQPRRVRVHYSAHEVESTASLAVPANWSLWKLAAEIKLKSGKLSVNRHKFSTPLVTANLLFEYLDFYELSSSSGSTSSRMGRRRANEEPDTSDFVGRFFSGPFSRGGQARASTPPASSTTTTTRYNNTTISGHAISTSLSLADRVFLAAHRAISMPNVLNTNLDALKGVENAGNSSTNRGRGGTLHCPRCGRRVADAHGVCQHCGEVAFQCRQCRHINYERLDAFLCVECGYCAFGEFSFQLKSESAPDLLPIETQAELETARSRLAGYSDTARLARCGLQRLLPQVAALARTCASTESSVPLFFVGRAPRVSRSIFFDQEQRLSLSTSPSSTRTRLVKHATRSVPSSRVQASSASAVEIAKIAVDKNEINRKSANKSSEEQGQAAKDSRTFLKKLQSVTTTAATLVRHELLDQKVPPPSRRLPMELFWGAVDAASCAIVASIDTQGLATPAFCAELAADTGCLFAAALPSSTTTATLFDRQMVDEDTSTNPNVDNESSAEKWLVVDPDNPHRSLRRVMTSVSSRSAVAASYLASARFEDTDGSIAGLMPLRIDSSPSRALPNRRGGAHLGVSGRHVTADEAEVDDIFPSPPTHLDEDENDGPIWAPGDTSFVAAFSASRRHAAEDRSGTQRSSSQSRSRRTAVDDDSILQDLPESSLPQALRRRYPPATERAVILEAPVFAAEDILTSRTSMPETLSRSATIVPPLTVAGSRAQRSSGEDIAQARAEQASFLSRLLGDCHASSDEDDEVDEVLPMETDAGGAEVDGDNDEEDGGDGEEDDGGEDDDENNDEEIDDDEGDADNDEEEECDGQDDEADDEDDEDDDDDDLRYDRQISRTTSNQSPNAYDENYATEDEEDEAAEVFLDLGAARRRRLEQQQQQSSSAQVTAPQRKMSVKKSAATLPSSRRAIMERFVSSVHERRLLAALETGQISKANNGSDARCRELVELYLLKCGPLHTDLRRAMRSAKETASRIREYGLASKTGDESRKRRLALLRNEDRQDSVFIESPHESASDTALAITRLAELGRVLALRCDNADSALTTHGFADALILAMSATLRCDPRAFRSSALALRALCARSETALRETHEAILDYDVRIGGSRRLDRITALHVALRDVLCAPPQDFRDDKNVWRMHVDLAATIVKSTSAAAKSSAELSEAVLRPCLAVLCRLLGDYIRDSGSIGTAISERDGPATNILSWIRRELRRSGSRSSTWLAPDQAREVLVLQRTLAAWRSVSSSSVRGTPMDTSLEDDTNIYSKKSWLLDAVTNKHNAAVRRQAALLILTVAKPTDGEYACLESAWSMLATAGSTTSPQLLSAVSELVLNSDSTTLEYLRRRGLGCFCCRLVRGVAGNLLRQDLLFTTSRDGGGATAAAVTASRSIPALNTLSAVVAKLILPASATKNKTRSLSTSSVGNDNDTPSTVDWQQRAVAALERASSESLHVSIEAGLALSDLQLLGSKETEAAAEILLTKVALAPEVILQKKARQGKQEFKSSRSAPFIISSRMGRSISGLFGSGSQPSTNNKSKEAPTPEPRSIEERLAFLAAATTVLHRRRMLLENKSSTEKSTLPRRIAAAHVLAGLPSGQDCEEPEPRLAAALSAGAIETLLDMMSEAACPKRVRPTAKLELRRAPTQDEYFRGSLPRTVLSVDDVPRLGVQEAEEDDDDDDADEPTMGDLRAKIAADLDMASAADMLELVVCERIVSLSLPIRLVYSKLWLPRARAAAAARSRRRSQLGALHGDGTTRIAIHDCEEEDDEDEEEIVHPHMEADEDCEEDEDEEEEDAGAPGHDGCEDEEDDEMMEDEGAGIVMPSSRRGRRAYRLSTGSDDDEDDEVPQQIHMEEDEDAVCVSVSVQQRRGPRASGSSGRREASMPPMVVTYRLTGVDGEATEERVESLASGPATEAVEDRYGATSAIVAAGGLHELAALAADVLAMDEEGVTSRALGLLRQCVYVNRHASALAEMGAPAALLGRLVRALRVGGINKDREVERLLALLERLAPVMRDDAGEVPSKSVGIDTNSSSHLETLVDGLRDARVAAALDRTPALRRAVCRLLPALAVGKRSAADSLASRMADWMRRPEQWARCFSETTAVLSDDGASDAHLDLVEASCLRETVEGLGDHATAPGAAELGDALERAGFVAAACRALNERLPSQQPSFLWLSSSEEEDRVPPATWATAIDAAGVRQVLLASLRALRGTCAASRSAAIACLDAGSLEVMHFLEQLPLASVRDVGLAAEACLDAIAGQDSVRQHGLDELGSTLSIDPAAGRVRHLRAVSKRQRIAFAQVRRTAVLNRLGLTEPPSAVELSAAPAPTQETEDTQSHWSCVVCREQFKPHDVLCAYVYAKLGVSDVGDADGAFLLATDSSSYSASSGPQAASGGASATSSGRLARSGGASSASRSASRPRRRHGVVSSVSAWNLIHSSCHREATRADRNLRTPRSEWDGAALRNSRVLCNSILPLKPSVLPGADASTSTAAYSAAVDRHFSCISQLGVSTRSSSSSSSSDAPARFSIVLHDATLLLLRLAHREQLHSDSGGGSRASNLMLVCYLLQLAGHLLESPKPADSPDRDRLRRLVEAFAKQASTALSRHEDDTPGTADDVQQYPPGSPEADNKRSRRSQQQDMNEDVIQQDVMQEDDDDDADHERLDSSDSLRLLAAHERQPPSPAKVTSVQNKRDRQRAELLSRLAECAPYVALVSLFNDEEQFSELKVVFATLAARRGLARAETRAAAREQSRLRSQSDASATSATGGPPSVSNLRIPDAHTQQRARNYARSMLAYVALLDCVKREICLSSVQDNDRVSLLHAEDSAIAHAAANLTTFYESVLLEAPDPRTILVDHLQIQPEALLLSSDLTALLFG